MLEAALILASLAAGVVLGAFYFGGLWWTLRRLPGARRPALLSLGSFTGRLAVCLAGFILLARSGRWELIIVAMAGFVLARTALVRMWGPHRGLAPAQTQDAGTAVSLPPAPRK